MSERLDRALTFDREELQAGIDEAEVELRDLRARVENLESKIHKARQLLEGGTAVLGDAVQERRLTLHEAMRKVLIERNNASATARELADEIQERDLYRKKDGTPVEINQIHARVNNYRSMFSKDGPRISLREAS